MKRLRIAIIAPAIAALLGLSANSGYGTTFNFSYTFIDSYAGSTPGDVVSGQLNGTAVGGGLVDVNSLLSIYLNGAQDTATPLAAVLVYPFAGSPAVVSYNPDNNNFVFADSSGNGFLMTPSDYVGGLSPGSAYVFIGGDVYEADSPTVTANWSLTPVPDGGTTAALLGGALVGLGALRRKLF